MKATMKTATKASNSSLMMNLATLPVSNANPAASLDAGTTGWAQPDSVSELYGRQELNRELRAQELREEQRELKAHQRRTGRFLEHDLLVQVWATLKTPERVNELTWWDDAFKRFINELQRLVGFSVGWIRADEARPYRHIHVAIVSHRPVHLSEVRQAWLVVIGPEHGKRVWVERYSPRGGGLAYQMKGDDESGSGWQLSPNIDLFRRSGDGLVHRPSSSRARRQARRILRQRDTGPSPRTPPSPMEASFQPLLQPMSSDGGPRPFAGTGCLQRRQQAVIRLVDPRRGGRLVASCPQTAGV